MQQLRAPLSHSAGNEHSSAAGQKRKSVASDRMHQSGRSLRAIASALVAGFHVTCVARLWADRPGPAKSVLSRVPAMEHANQDPFLACPGRHDIPIFSLTARGRPHGQIHAFHTAIT